MGSQEFSSSTASLPTWVYHVGIKPGLIANPEFTNSNTIFFVSVSFYQNSKVSFLVPWSKWAGESDTTQKKPAYEIRIWSRCKSHRSSHDQTIARRVSKSDITPAKLNQQISLPVPLPVPGNRHLSAITPTITLHQSVVWFQMIFVYHNVVILCRQSYVGSLLNDLTSFVEKSLGLSQKVARKYRNSAIVGEWVNASYRPKKKGFLRRLSSIFGNQTCLRGNTQCFQINFFLGITYLLFSTSENAWIIYIPITVVYLGQRNSRIHEGCRPSILR